MKLLTRDTSAFRFLTLGGLLSKKVFNRVAKIETPPSLTESAYLQKKQAFGVDEENVRSFVIDLLKNGLGWQTVRKDHDILATHGEERLLVECKHHNSRLLYLDEHKGGAPNETATEELQRNLKRTGCKWGLLTDGVTFRFIYNAELAPDLFDNYLEFSLQDMVHSTARWPDEFYWLLDFLSPSSHYRSFNPSQTSALSQQNTRKIVALIRRHPRGLHTVIKALAVAALEDMGVRPLHTGLKSVKCVETRSELNAIFESVESDDADFHSASHWISDELCRGIKRLFLDLAEIDFCHIDHEFFGIVYQKFINNGNASHYTNSKLSREMANYIASQSAKSQRATTRPIFLENNDFILDPALGSGQLLRGLLPFHRVFFRGNSSGIDGWRRLAGHFMGRDIDPTAIWIAKINIWLATADKGERLVALPEFKKLDVITATINRRAGQTIREAFLVEERSHVAACVSNPPWDAFKNDRRRGVIFDQAIVDKIKSSLQLEVRQLNRAQIFLRIIQRLGAECANMRFSVILPDSTFVDTNDDLRASLRGNLDFYFSYPRNLDPQTGNRIFGDVDATRKFGIIFGRSTTEFESLICYPFGNSTAVEIDETLSQIGEHTAFPLLAHPLQAGILRKWKQHATRRLKWRAGEFDTSLWASRAGREESPNGPHKVVGGAAICDEENAWSKHPVDLSRTWKRMRQVCPPDAELSRSARTIFSDYLNNSKKLNSASYLPSGSGINVTNKIIYSTDTDPNDWLIFDSAVFGSLVECYGTSQNMNAWRMSALGAPARLSNTVPLLANIELCESLGLNIEEAQLVFALNQNWLSSAISESQWLERIAAQPAAIGEIETGRASITRIRRANQIRRRRTSQRA